MIADAPRQRKLSGYDYFPVLLNPVQSSLTLKPNRFRKVVSLISQGCMLLSLLCPQ